MTQKSRDKEYWLIPKRANLHQSVYLLKGIVELGYNNRAWNTSKQDRLGSYLGKNGSTNSGKNIRPQSLRTLFASIPQFFGLAYIDTNTTPDTIVVTKCGLNLIEEFSDYFESYNCSNLRESEKENLHISSSKVFTQQFIKLQITNPIILKNCENIFIFPLVYILKILKHTKYLTNEEIALYVFRSNRQDLVDFTVQEILNFRGLSYSSQELLVNKFKGTHLGNISLVQAPSSRYFQKLCVLTGVICKGSMTLNNPITEEKRRVTKIEIDKSKEEEVNKIIDGFSNETYDFRDNISLWIDYIGDPEVKQTPKTKFIYNKTNQDLLVTIHTNKNSIIGELIMAGKSINFPVVENKTYEVLIYDTRGNIIQSKEINFVDVDISITTSLNIKPITKDTLYYVNEINDHIDSKNFSHKYSKYLSVIKNVFNKDYLTSKNLRGARLEYLFYKLLCVFEERLTIDDIVWNGQLNEFGIPTPSPGGPKGNPDILLFKENKVVVFELTTIKPKSEQWKAEGASVPDHLIEMKSRYPNNQIIGVYLAPIIHEERVTKPMISRLSNTGINLKCIDIKTFLFELENNISDDEEFNRFLGA